MINIFTFAADDDPVSLKIYEQIFKEIGYKDYRLFTNSRNFLESFNEKVHIAVIDFYIDEKNGFDLLRHIRSINKRCKVIIISAENEPEVIEDLLNEGAYKFVRKYSLRYEWKLKLKKEFEYAMNEVYEDYLFAQKLATTLIHGNN